MPGHKAPEAARREQILGSAYRVAAQHGLDGLTIRQVASAAGLSSGLVLFHYKTKQQLLLALLEWLIEGTLRPPAALSALPSDRSALAGFHTLIHREMQRLSAEPERINLLFGFWVRGRHDPAIGLRMRQALARYREAFRDSGQALLDAEPERFRGVTAEGLATLAVSFVKGCAVQAMIDPQGFDIAQHLRAARCLFNEAD
ncbi:MAG TPA: TetR family transcriptional regulator [Gemmatimonadales bacterium]|jgi:AcrR family transcriptional regulator|nr:TetR family transcriptional regulator [Gemmatimonadales bacterium]